MNKLIVPQDLNSRVRTGHVAWVNILSCSPSGIRKLNGFFLLQLYVEHSVHQSNTFCPLPIRGRILAHIADFCRTLLLRGATSVRRSWLTRCIMLTATLSTGLAPPI
ncbi:unnamed protein product [Dibothriocephalus latus]|uniref:Uncharacterized protein n=1 Tax=Dibothriocephalus latus TaxID=60516 RepID=A0A3P6UR02_DIBLA|nr:unnamed protein product [Dibothriocephalus latus]